MYLVEYDGFIGHFSYDPEIPGFHGHVVNCRDVITFSATEASQMRNEMITSIESHRAFCQSISRAIPASNGGVTIICHEGFVAVYSADAITGNFCGKVINCDIHEVSFSSEKAEDMPRLLAEGVNYPRQFCSENGHPAPLPTDTICA